jgi:hypothetical protein
MSLFDILEKTNYSGFKGIRMGESVTTRDSRGRFEGDETAVFCGCDGGYMNLFTC